MKAFKGAMTSVNKSIKGTQAKSAAKHVDQFYEQFGLLPSERLFAEYPISVLNGVKVMHGKLFLTAHFFCLKAKNDDKDVIVKFDLLNVERCVPCRVEDKEVDGNTVQYLEPIVAARNVADAKTLPNSIQIFMRERVVHQFFGVPDFDKFFNLFDHLVRAAHALRAQGM
eukprot:TRINITY_DN13748_c0_g1_i1.p1 TRINITY_DN13748_c0_g1~~TRINITY_DN13748_c0_g1_i1.p1  ORF type:complete len:169 (-),score=50.87 TRINITY_DN13748_c0_g1_i1:34-540(-)